MEWIWQKIAISMPARDRLLDREKLEKSHNRRILRFIYFRATWNHLAGDGRPSYFSGQLLDTFSTNRGF